MRALGLAGFLFVVSAQAAPVTLTAKDGLKIDGEYVAPPKGSHKPLIVLFHQAHANKAEYAPIQPKLEALGYGSLAIDQRAGGELFGADNATAARLKSAAKYEDAFPDMEAALSYAAAHSPTHQAIVWGSSYSAALAFHLAAAHPKQVRAVMAFSPGEYFDNKDAVRSWASKVKAPIFVTSAPDEEEVSQAKQILAASPAKVKEQFVPKDGVHGASILREDRDEKGAAAAWNAVKQFLAKLR